MTRGVRVHELPGEALWVDLRGATAVVIDVLRASSTVCAALEAGAGAIVLAETVEEARRRVTERRAAGVAALLGGERGGVRVEGFDLGNSPLEYTPEAVGGREVVFTTTNGTRAAGVCGGAARVLVGCFRNLSAVCGAALVGEGDTHLVCAGTDGGHSEEDERFAGAALCVLEGAGLRGVGDGAARAREAWRVCAEGRTLREAAACAVATSWHAERLRGLGLAADVVYCAEVDATGVVPEIIGGVVRGGAR
ncbi:MAG: 2-phosphosulfolactate phosphatase [Phycisphaerales bacterium]